MKTMVVTPLHYFLFSLFNIPFLLDHFVCFFVGTHLWLQWLQLVSLAEYEIHF